MSKWIEIPVSEYIKLFKSCKMVKLEETDDVIEYKGKKGLKLKATNLRHYGRFFKSDV